MQRKIKPNLTLVIIASLVSLPPPDLVQAEIQRTQYEANGNYLLVEVLKDDLVHFEYGTESAPALDKPIETTDMVCKTTDNVPIGVCKTDYAGATQFAQEDNKLETQDLQLQINLDNLYVTVIDKTKNNVQLTTISPLDLSQPKKGLAFTRPPELDVYGLGQQFRGEVSVDWDNRTRESGDFGNVMEGFNGGANGNTQIPIAYVVKRGTQQNYAIFLDNQYKQRWDFSQQLPAWKVETFGGKLRFYVLTGPDLLDLRKDFMELVGKPLVPPKKMFGLWVSEYGYDNWQELDSKLTTLRDQHFPVDGLVLDLQWFGGISANSDDTRMGSLTWDDSKFPNAKQKIADLKDTQGVGVITIEEAYIGKNRPEHSKLNENGCLVKKADGTPVYLTSNPWWGKGGMIDYTNDTCGDYWYDEKRLALITDGVMGHWTDLGEPEMYDPNGKYAEGTEADAHNVFNLKWVRSIHRGYTTHQIQQRPFMLSRSGAAGIQRFGAVMWSGDIGADWKNLAAHAANQANMSFSGIDYYGADIGGFHRNGINGDRLKDLYTEWYAFGAMFDVPVRPHTENLCNCKETAPDRVGEDSSNLKNTQQRYELIPYLYSLAHRAHRYGEPVMPPLVMYYQTDSNVLNRGNEKMLGQNLLAAAVTKEGETEQDVYLPANTWFDWYTHQKIISNGEYLSKVPERGCDKSFRLPLYAREGAIIPLAFVDKQTMNALGKRQEGNLHNELVTKIFAFGEGGAINNCKDPTPKAQNSFTLYEDDGETIAYQTGAVRTTDISQQRQGNEVTVEISQATGTYVGAPDARNNVIKLVADRPTSQVTLNDQKLTELTDATKFDLASTGWFNDKDNNTVIVKTGVMSVNEAKKLVFTLNDKGTMTTVAACPPDPGAIKFSCKHGDTTFGASVYVVGNTPKLGLWDPNKGVKLEPNGPYPTWTGDMSGLPCDTPVEWKCIKRLEGGNRSVVEWEPAGNNVLSKPCGGGTTEGDFRP
jgi:alpha-glucosidase